MKETLAWWGLVFIAVMGATYRITQTQQSTKKIIAWIRNHYPEVIMLGWIAFYWFISIRSTLNIGVRHILPTLPFIILLASGQIARLADWLRHYEKGFIKAFSFIVAILLGWHVYENVRSYPFYLSYFNQTVGGSSGGYNYVTDSNLDWGQDLKRLSQFASEKGIRSISLDYFGWADPSFYLGKKYIWTTASSFKTAQEFLDRNQSGGWIAVSATFLQQASSPSGENSPLKQLEYVWLKGYEPEAVIGNSIFVWHITK